MSNIYFYYISVLQDCTCNTTMKEKENGICKPNIIASFHPAFLMRQPEQKKMAWIDLKLVREKIKQLKL